MSICFHPHLFDAARFERERGGLAPDDPRFEALVEACIIDEQDLEEGELAPDDDAEDDVLARRSFEDPIDGPSSGSLTDHVRAAVRWALEDAGESDDEGSEDEDGETRREFAGETASLHELDTLLGHLAFERGRLAVPTPRPIPKGWRPAGFGYTGYLTPPEVERLEALLATRSLDADEADEDRLLLLGLLRAAKRHGRGLAFSFL